MGLADTARRAVSKSIPFGAYLELTYACNWRCVFCYNPRHHDRRALDTEEWLEVLRGLRRLGTLQLTLTGGEPMARPDFFEIAEHARSLAFALRIYTNGSFVDSTEVARRLAELQPLAVELSLHGATASVHDQTTGRSGSFEHLWRGVRFLLDQDVRLTLKSPVTSLNEHQIDAMIEMAAEVDVPYRLDPSITPRDDGDLYPQRYAASDEARRRVLAMAVDSELIAPVSRNAGDANCGLGRVTIVVDPEGGVFPCMQWRGSSLGNVRQQSIGEIWSGSLERARLAKLAVEVNERLLSEPSDRVALPFCPALAEQRTGDPLTLDQEYIAASLDVVALARRKASSGA